MKITYTAHGTATNGGRGVGDAQTDDGRLAVKFSTPKAMGGDDGPGTNPEQLVALAYSACFLGAMGAAAKRNGKTLPDDATVTADVSFADREDKVGFTIVPKLTARSPDGKGDIEATMKLAHDICPISDLIRHAHDVGWWRADPPGPLPFAGRGIPSGGHRLEELHDIAGEHFRHFERGEMAAAVELAPVDDVLVIALGESADRQEVVGEHGDARRDRRGPRLLHVPALPSS